ncbi:hypothetical protein F164LOC_21265 [Pectobacterium carotovorum]|nr:hypothetical protein F164LOC_21265 [Pectobacterium carotovorum]
MILTPFFAMSLTSEEFMNFDEWRVFYKTKSGAEIYIKGGVIDDDIISTWYRINSPSLNVCNKEPFYMSIDEHQICDSEKKMKIETEIARVFFDCHKRKMKLINETHFNYHKELIYKGNNSKSEWEDLIPDTLSEKLYYRICGL